MCLNIAVIVSIVMSPYKNVHRIEKILEDSLDTISSPSVKIQIMGGKESLGCKGKTLLGVANKLLKTKHFQQCFAFTPEANFPAHIPGFLLKSYIHTLNNKAA